MPIRDPYPLGFRVDEGGNIVEPQQPVDYWHDQFLYALSGLSWAVGKLGDEGGYAGEVHDRLTHPTITFPVADSAAPREERK